MAKITFKQDKLLQALKNNLSSVLYEDAGLKEHINSLSEEKRQEYKEELQAFEVKLDNLEKTKEAKLNIPPYGTLHVEAEDGKETVKLSLFLTAMGQDKPLEKDAKGFEEVLKPIYDGLSEKFGKSELLYKKEIG